MREMVRQSRVEYLCAGSAAVSLSIRSRHGWPACNSGLQLLFRVSSTALADFLVTITANVTPRLDHENVLDFHVDARVLWLLDRCEYADTHFTCCLGWLVAVIC